MGSGRRRSTLGKQIAAALNKGRNTSGRDPLGRLIPVNSTRALACTGVALVAMQSAQVGAVGLGNINLQSGLGQPLRATVPITIGTGESVKAGCVRSTETGRGELGKLPEPNITVPRASAAGTYSLRIETANPLYEPMYELSLLVDCPGTALLVRHYVLMLDLPGMDLPAQDPVTTSQVPTEVAPQVSIAPAIPAPTTTSVPAPQRRAAPRRARDPIPSASEYRVREGDTLSTIAARVTGRPRNATWDVAMQIFARNPDAFIRSNPDLIKLGAAINIPSVAEMELAAGITVPDYAPAAPEPIPEPAPSAASDIEAVTREDSVAVTSRTEVPTEVQNVPQVPSIAGESADRSPFADEAPDARSSQPTTTEAPTQAPVEVPIDTVVTVGEETAEATDEINPFLAIALGLLLGLALSLLIVRGRVIEMVTGLLRRDAAEAQPAKAAPEVDTFNEFDASVSDFQGATMNDFDDSAADEAFATDPEFDPEATPVQFGTPHEDTYIVEVSEAEQTAAEQEGPEDLYEPTMHALPVEDLANKSAITDPLADIDRDNVDLLIDDDNQPGDPAASEDTVLSKLFDEDFDPAAMTSSESLDPTSELPAKSVDPTANMQAENLDPTAEMPGANLEPTAEMPGGNLEPTAEMPAGNLEPTAEVRVQNLEPTAEMPVQNLDPTAELPADFVDPADVIDPTAEPSAEEREAQMTMSQSFSENLERLDMAAANKDDAIKEKLANTDSTTSTLQVSGSARDAMSTAEINLEELVKGAAEDETLSQTLHEALSLLERDYEDEFTASQILERKEIEKALEEEDDDDTVAARKVKN